MDPGRCGPSKLPPKPCDLCGEPNEKSYAVFSGGDILKICVMCKAEVAGGT